MTVTIVKVFLLRTTSFHHHVRPRQPSKSFEELSQAECPARERAVNEQHQSVESASASCACCRQCQSLVCCESDSTAERKDMPFPRKHHESKRPKFGVIEEGSARRESVLHCRGSARDFQLRQVDDDSGRSRAVDLEGALHASHPFLYRDQAAAEMDDIPEARVAGEGAAFGECDSHCL